MTQVVYKFNNNIKKFNISHIILFYINQKKIHHQVAQEVTSLYIYIYMRCFKFLKSSLVLLLDICWFAGCILIVFKPDLMVDPV